MPAVPTRRDRAVLWTLHHVPAPLLLNPERVAIKMAVALVGGVALLFVRPSSLTSLLPPWVPYLWGVTWVLGGLCGLVGFWRSSRPVEMAGHRFIILGAIVYGVALCSVVGVPALPSVILIALVAVPSAVRLLIAAGSRATRMRRR